MSDPRDDATSPPLDERASYAYFARHSLRFSDLDALGHVNNLATAALFESVRVSFLAEAGMPVSAPEYGFVIARMTVDYLRELHFPGEVEIGTRVLRIGRSSVTIGQGLFSNGDCIATGTAVCVRIDRASGRAIALDAALRARLAALSEG